MSGDERSDLLAAVLNAIADVRRDTPSKDAFDSLARTVDSQGVTIEEIRKNSKGANNWSRVASIAAAAAPIVTALGKAAGWF